MQKNHAYKIKIYKMFISVLLLSMITFFVLKPGVVISSAKNALILCFNTVIPSLFPFFVCSGLLIKLGFAQVLSKRIGFIMKPLFNVNGSGSSAFLLGIISGYPTGAITAVQLYENKLCNKTEAERLLAFCNNSGPIFILGALTCMYNSQTAGVILYISHILAALTVGIIFRFYKKTSVVRDTHTDMPSIATPFATVFANVMKESLNTILLICASVVFFKVVIDTAVYVFNLQGYVLASVAGFTEFTSGINVIAGMNVSLSEKIVLSSVVLGFAGISVHFQVLNILSETDLSAKPYFAGKLLHSVFSSLYVLIMLRFIPVGTPVFMNIFPMRTESCFVCTSVFVFGMGYILSGILFAFMLTVISYISCRLKGKRKHCEK